MKSLKKAMGPVAAAACVVALCAALAPATAWADEKTQDSSTTVNVTTTPIPVPGSLSVTVPTVVPTVLNSSTGVVSGPTTCNILNGIESNPVYLKSVSASVAPGFILSSNAGYAAATGNNVFWMKITGTPALSTDKGGDIDLGATPTFTTATQWKITAGQSVALSITGAMKNVNIDLTNPTAAATLNWTFSNTALA